MLSCNYYYYYLKLFYCSIAINNKMYSINNNNHIIVIVIIQIHNDFAAYLMRFCDALFENHSHRRKTHVRLNYFPVYYANKIMWQALRLTCQ